MGGEQSAHCPRASGGPGSGPVGSTACTGPCTAPELAARLSRQRCATGAASAASQLKDAVGEEELAAGMLPLKATLGGIVSWAAKISQC